VQYVSMMIFAGRIRHVVVRANPPLRRTRKRRSTGRRTVSSTSFASRPSGSRCLCEASFRPWPTGSGGPSRPRPPCDSVFDSVRGAIAIDVLDGGAHHDCAERDAVVRRPARVVQCDSQRLAETVVRIGRARRQEPGHQRAQGDHAIAPRPVGGDGRSGERVGHRRCESRRSRRGIGKPKPIGGSADRLAPIIVNLAPASVAD
jgi:hypothetical protein